MRKSILGLSAILMSVAATPALAQDEKPADAIKITGNVSLVSDYRFRGFSQSSGEKAAIQGGLTVAHESGLYLSTWASSIDFPNYDGNNHGLTTEVDIFGGWAGEVTPGVTLDVGLLYYLYPKKLDFDVATDFFEPYVNLSGTIGPVSLKVGANYAWDQSALGDNSALYLHVEPTIAVPDTPFSLVGHAGWAKSDSFLGGPDGETFDYSLGATATYKMLTFGVSYVNTDVSKSLGKEALGADGAVIFSIGAAF